MALLALIHCDRCGKLARRQDGKIDTAPYMGKQELYRRLRYRGWSIKHPDQGGHCCPECRAVAELAKRPPPARGRVAHQRS